MINCALCEAASGLTHLPPCFVFRGRGSQNCKRRNVFQRSGIPEIPQGQACFPRLPHAWHLQRSSLALLPPALPRAGRKPRPMLCPPLFAGPRGKHTNDKYRAIASDSSPSENKNYPHSIRLASVASMPRAVAANMKTTHKGDERQLQTTRRDLATWVSGDCASSARRD